MANEQRRRGFCPRVWTPMESGDGLLVRVHAATRWLDAALLEHLVALASAHGNGLVEITRRANLQLRGVRPDALSALQARLVQLGLAAASAWGERRFMLHATPWLGLDPACAALGPLLMQLEQRLVDPKSAEHVHPKLAIALSGPHDELAALGADMSIALDPRRPGLARLAVAIAPRTRRTLGSCALDEVGAWVAGWLERLSEAPADARDSWQGQRMHEWVARHGVRALDRHRPASLQPLVASDDAAPAEVDREWLGIHAAEPANVDAVVDGDESAPDQPRSHSWLGAMLAFGAGDPAQWRALTALSTRYGDGNVRTHPDRGLLLRGVRAHQAVELATALTDIGLCVDRRDPLSRVVACAGAPACTSAHGETRQLARDLAEHARPWLTHGASLHVSGCEKSCARSGASAIVVVHSRAGAHLGFGIDAAQAARAPAQTLPQLRAALSARALSASTAECATSAPYPPAAPGADPNVP